MPRIVSIWLRSWPLARRLKDEQKKSSASADAKLDVRRPIVLVAQEAAAHASPRSIRAAAHAGLTQGELLSNARVEGARSSGPRRRSRRRCRCARKARSLVRALYANRIGLERRQRRRRPVSRCRSLRPICLAAKPSCSPIFSLDCRVLVSPRALPSPQRRARPGPWRATAKSRLQFSPSGREADALRPLPLAALRLPDETLILARRLRSAPRQ